jgi:DnaJ-class molecular chaperone
MPKKIKVRSECPTCSGHGTLEGVGTSGLSIEDLAHSMIACPTCEGYGELNFEEESE